MKKGDLIFCYGTLRRDASSDLSKNPMADFVGEDYINGKLYALGWFPGVKDVPCSGTKAKPQHFDVGAPHVRGDVFTILSDDLVVHLDRYEGYPDLYGRIETETAEGRHVHVYVYNRDVHEDAFITSGDWITNLEVAQPSPSSAG